MNDLGNCLAVAVVAALLLAFASTSRITVSIALIGLSARELMRMRFIPFVGLLALSLAVGV